MSYFGVRCNACTNIFLMQQIPAWDYHPEMAVGQTIMPLCCPYCGEIDTFSVKENIKDIVNAVIEFASDEREFGPGC